jgi:hypothetical protein
MIRFSGLSFGMREMITMSAARITLIATMKISRSRMIRSTAFNASMACLPALRDCAPLTRRSAARRALVSFYRSDHLDSKG